MSRSLCFHVRTYNRCDWIKIFSPNRGSSKKSVSLGACLIQQEELPLPIVQSFHSNFSNPLSVESWQADCKPPKWTRATLHAIYHETGESTSQTSVKWLEKRAVARRCCTFVEERLSQHPCQAFVKEGAGTLADLSHTKAGPRIEATSE